MANHTIDKIEYNNEVYVLQDNVSGYEANQNAFSNVKVGSTTIAADAKTDTLELAAGTNISLTPDATNDKVTIAFSGTIPDVPSNIVNTITTTAGAHTAITSQKGNVSFNVPTTAAHVGAAASSHAHGNITSGGDITATAPTIASGDQIIINDHSASKITNGPTFDGSTTTTALTPKGTWESFAKTSAIPTKTTTTPKMDGTAAVGSETTYAAGDHIHPSDTSRVPTTRKVNGKALSSDVTLTGEDINVGSSSGDSVSIYQTFANLEESLADTFDTVYTDLDDKVDKVDGKDLSTNDYTTTEKNKLSGIATGAEVNQNAFSNVKVKPTASASTTTTIAADAKTDTLSLEAGNYIELTADATNDKITVGAVLPMASSSPAVAGLMSSTDKGKLDGITSGAEVNQNAFSNVKVGSTTIAADSKTDTLELVAGTGVTLTPDTTNDKVTISATSSGGGLVNLQDGTGTGSIEMSNASAVKSYQTALGKYNKEDTGTDKDLSNFAFIIGDGSSSSARSNLFTINNSGLVATHPSSSSYNWKTSSASPNETQYFTGFEIRDRDEVRLSHVDAHIDTTGKVGAVLGAERMVGNDIVRNQIYLYVDAAGTKSYIIDDPAAFRSALDIYDHVFEQGTSGIWTYRKWSSGIAECWGMSSSTSYAVTNQYVNGYYANLGTVSFPSALFVAAPCVQATRTNTGSGSALVFVSLHTVTASSFAGFVGATSSGTYPCQFSYHAIGRWKS